jgi:GT2 family glycosyltransferase
LSSIFAAQGDLALQVLVIDNASADGSVEMVREQFPRVELQANTENRFYAAGNNQALEAATAPLKLLLNSDIRVPPEGLVTLVEWMRKHPGVGGIAPRMVYPDGRLQTSCRSFPDPEVVLYEVLGLSRLWPRSKRFGKYRMTWWDYAEERAVEQPMASALLLRTEALEQVGLFDEAFPMFFNDVDLCLRLWEAGWPIWYTPATTFVHHHGAATRQVRREMVAESGRSFLHFYRKHYRGKVPWLSYVGATTLLRIAYGVRRLVASLRS